MIFFRFIRDKFDLLLTAALFVLVLLIYLQYAGTDAAKTLEYILNALSVAFFTLVGVRRPANQVQADIDTANIQQAPAAADDAGIGDTEPTVRIISTERKVNENDKSETPAD
jgi:hypothetical protein